MERIQNHMGAILIFGLPGLLKFRFLSTISLVCLLNMLSILLYLKSNLTGDPD